jgi:2',3'-cyclic-nucleotide 2'-phosphodiesterase (5'-nucleotidase family)
MFKLTSISVLIFLSLIVSACGTQTEVANRSFLVLAINDVYRIDTMHEGKVGGYARFKTLRDELALADPDLLVLHGGDFLSPSILGQRYGGEQIVDIMNQIDGDKETFDDRFFVVPGNHEFDVAGVEGALWIKKRIDESKFWWLSSNINWSKGTHPDIVQEFNHVITEKIIEAGGIKVGLFGLTLDRDATKYAPINNDYIGIARQKTKELKDAGAELVIGLTHLFLDDDIEILQTLGADGPDIIFGGHEHSAVIEQVNGRYILKADSDLLTTNIVKLTLGENGLEVEVENREIDIKTSEDPALKHNIKEWINRYHMDECGAVAGEKCGSSAFGYTSVDLIGVESEIRLFETNLGNWIADTMLEAFSHSGSAQIAFINAGAIRYNQNVRANSGITDSLINQILPYDPQLYLIEITGLELKNILNRSVNNWKGNGYWLQVSGIAFRQDIVNERAEDIMIMENGTLRPVDDNEIIRAVTVGYILDTNGPQDGYTMLSDKNIIANHNNGLKLHEFIQTSLLEKGDEHIAPVVEGRICNPTRPQHCLLDDR